MAVDTIIDPTAFHDDVQISEIDLDASFREQASLFASYASKHFQAQRQSGNKKIMLDLARSKLDHAIRERMNEEKGEDGKPRKFTEAMVDAEIRRTPAYIGALKDYNEAEAIEALLKNALEAFKQRKDMLISLGANQREEMKGELRMAAGAGADREALLAETARRMRAERLAP